MFEYNQLVPVMFGAGAIKELANKVSELGCKKVMCVFDSGVKASGIGEKALAILKNAGVNYIVFDKITADPPTDIMDEGGALARAEGVDCVVGIGGGSSMDAAKAIALLLTHDSPISQHLTLPPTFLKSSVPIILVPTTAGTGSECTQVCVLSDVQRNLKLAIFVRSTLAIVDPELTLTVPPSVTANTGLDAFSHAAESVTAKKWNPRSELLALAAIEKITKYLPVAFDDGSNLEARTQLALASNWAGIAFADTDVHFGHSMADGLSCMFHTPHGMNCAWATPETLVLVSSVVPEKVKLIGEAMGAEFDGSETPEQIGEITADLIRSLMKRVKLKSPKDFGFTREQVESAYETAFASGMRFNCPVEITPEIAKETMVKIYDNYQ